MSGQELKCQRELIVSAEKAGGFGEKLSHRFKAGVPDLIIKLPNLPTALIEVKEVTWPKKPTTMLPVDLTPLQRRCLRRYQEAGGLAGWVLFSKADNTWMAYASRCLETEQIGQVPMSCNATHKERGKDWDIVALLMALCP